MLTIVIGTKNSAKINGVKEGIKKITELKNPKINYIFQKVETGISEMPLTQEEFLTGSVYISNGKEGYLEKTGSIELPKNITHELFEKQKNLGKVIEELTHEKGISTNNGTFGELTNNILTRSASFELATTLTMVPFFNKYYK